MIIKTTLKTYFLAAVGCFALNGYSQTLPLKVKKFGRPTQFSQCGTVEYENILLRKNSKRPNTQQFEQWLAPLVAAQKAKNRTAAAQNTTQVLTIPVVVHVIHSGVPVGTLENIADAQILSQLTVLNQDFRKLLGTNGYNTNPAGTDTQVEFCLAQQDEAGLNTTGIIRYDLATDDYWEMEDIEVLKTQTQWNPSKYLNLWIVNEMYAQGMGLAGYAQFPVNSGLDGIDDEGGIITTANTDGVVLAANCFGSEEIYPQGYYLEGYNLGRSATHEIGHFLGLRHIWGDDYNCNGNDYCSDTPVADGPNSGCPDAGYDSCLEDDGIDMVQNYMDYTSDSCKNIFTEDQKDRIVTVLANSPRRHSLTTSNGCTPGIIYDNDGSLRIEGGADGCGTTFGAQLVLTNSGNTALTAAVINYRIDAQAQQTYNWTGNLAIGQSATITLPQLTVSGGSHIFYTNLNTVNGVADQAPVNDTKSQAFVITSSYNTTHVVITVETDDFGEETIWVLFDSNENFIASNVDPETFEGEYGPYESNQTYTATADVNNNECYTFGMYDLSADGICCEYGEGHYSIATADGTVIAEGGQFSEQIVHTFSISDIAGLTDLSHTLNSITLYPNPTNSMFTIAIPQNAATPDGYTICNSLGQVVGNGKFASNEQPVDVSTYANGIYFIRINSADSAKTLQFIKN
jgi:hypothetical protein